MGETERNELREKALAGDAQAQYRLAKNIDIHGGKENASARIEAVKWYRLAAEQGHVKAQCRLGACLAAHWVNSSPVPLTEDNKREGLMWLKKAAKQDSAEACIELAECYWFGVGCEKDLEEAVRWVKLALRLDDEQSGGNYSAFTGRCDDCLSDLTGECGEDLVEELEGEMPSMEYEYVAPTSFGKPIYTASSNSSSSSSSSVSHSAASSTGCFTTLLMGALAVVAVVLCLL